MKKLNRSTYRYKLHPERVLQIGEGNFLRCFVGWMIDILNDNNGLDAGIVVARPIDTETPPSLNMQDGLYTTLLRGYDRQGRLRDEKRIITAVTREVSIYREYDNFLALATNPRLRFIVSNTTEAGIAYNEVDRFEDSPPITFPAKLTRFLYERFVACEGSDEAGFILLPCELIDNNGEELKKIVLQYADLWGLSAAFRTWVEQANTFCSTLVDRIVTGYPKDEAEQLAQELGYIDRFMVVSEYFHLFVIQAPQETAAELKIAGSGLNIEIVDDLKPYKKRKVAILNGCHTALVPIAHLCGIELVRDAVAQPQLAKFLTRLLNTEIIPGLEMPASSLQDYADSVIDRFRNPFIRHRLLDISLNSMTKFKTRLLPQLLVYYRNNGQVPPLITFSLAALICFYRGECNGSKYPLQDDLFFLNLYRELWGRFETGLPTQDEATEIARRILDLESHWGTSLLSLDGLLENVADNIFRICHRGMEGTLQEILP